MAEIRDLSLELRLLERQLLLCLVDLLAEHDQLRRLLVDLRLNRPELGIEGGDLALQHALLLEELANLRLGGDDLPVETLQLVLLVVDRVGNRAQQQDSQDRNRDPRVEASRPHCLRNRLTPR